MLCELLFDEHYKAVDDTKVLCCDSGQFNHDYWGEKILAERKIWAEWRQAALSRNNWPPGAQKKFKPKSWKVKYYKVNRFMAVKPQKANDMW